MTGNATFNGVRVRGPKVRATSGEDQYIVWEIRGTSEWVNTVSPLIYGKVPSGYKQVYPEQGEAPPIVEGERYFVRILTTGAKGAEKYFTIRNGKVIEEEF